MKILVTGGKGFIGSNFIRFLVNNTEETIINVDVETYAGKGKNLEHMGLNSRFIDYKVNICDKEAVEKVFIEHKIDLVFNFAAESHVDRSITSSEDFVITNVVGTVNLLDLSRKYAVKKFIQISTDEVYGSLKNEDSSSKENDIICPRSPYSASKAAAELFAMSYFHTHNFPVIITRSSNNYGLYQFPEKLLPLFITNLIDGQKVPLMWSDDNPGLNVRDWLHVEDNCRAIWLISQKGVVGEIYNIAGENEKTNIEVTRMLLNEFKFGENMIQKILHRKGHDFKYSIDASKLKNLGFEYLHKDFNNEIKLLVEWYKNNQDWWRPLKCKA